MKLTGDRNQCTGCEKMFNSTVAFERHRTGSFGIDRRCMTVEEMQAKGMAVNSSGFWVTRLMTEAILSRTVGTKQPTSSLTYGDESSSYENA